MRLPEAIVGGTGGHTGEPATEGSVTAVALPAGFIGDGGMERFSNRSHSR
jgi:hypothetical protein